MIPFASRTIESVDVQHKQIQNHLPTDSAYKNLLVILLVDQQELLWSSSCQNLCSGAFGRGMTASSMRITCDNAISGAHISLQP